MVSNRQILADMHASLNAMCKAYEGEWWPVDPTDPTSAVTNGQVTMSARAFAQLLEQPAEILPTDERHRDVCKALPMNPGRAYVRVELGTGRITELSGPPPEYQFKCRRDNPDEAPSLYATCETCGERGGHSPENNWHRFKPAKRSLEDLRASFVQCMIDTYLDDVDKGLI